MWVYNCEACLIVSYSHIHKLSILYVFTSCMLHKYAQLLFSAQIQKRGLYLVVRWSAKTLYKKHRKALIIHGGVGDPLLSSLNCLQL